MSLPSLADPSVTPPTPSFSPDSKKGGAFPFVLVAIAGGVFLGGSVGMVRPSALEPAAADKKTGSDACSQSLIASTKRVFSESERERE